MNAARRERLAKRALVKAMQSETKTTELESRHQIFGANIYIQTTEPINPQPGDIWYDVSQYIEN